jgi:meiotic recombination protein SPO11
MRHPHSLFETQAQCDQIVEYFAKLIQVPQHQLMITYNSKGLVHGKLRIYTDSRNFVSCDSNPDQGTLIPSIVYDGGGSIRIRNPQRSDGVPDGRHTVLVIEKATVFQRLIASKLVEQSQHSVTLVTGGGYPDLPTRRFVALCHAANFRVVGIADCDPFGIEIMMTYKWGSSQHAREKQALSAPSLEWLGLKPEHLGDSADSITFGAPKNPLLPVDIRKIDSVILRLQAAEDEDALEWLAQAQLMRHLDCKCELEILHVVCSNSNAAVQIHTSAGHRRPRECRRILGAVMMGPGACCKTPDSANKCSELGTRFYSGMQATAYTYT